MNAPLQIELWESCESLDTASVFPFTSHVAARSDRCGPFWSHFDREPHHVNVPLGRTTNFGFVVCVWPDSLTTIKQPPPLLSLLPVGQIPTALWPALPRKTRSLCSVVADNRTPPLHRGRQRLWLCAEAVRIPGGAGGVFAGRRRARPVAAPRLRCRKRIERFPFTRCVSIMADKGVDLKRVNM